MKVGNIMEEKQVKIEKERTLKDKLVEWGKSLVIAWILALFVLNFIAFFAFVPTSSMVPTINEGQRIIVWKIFRYFDWEHRGIEFGDIVVFKHTEGSEKEKLLVKRVIGMPGDRIRIENGLVFRNDSPLVEDYVKNGDSFFMNEITVPENEIFVLGDNRRNSFDSRYWEYQTVPIKNIVGEVIEH